VLSGSAILFAVAWRIGRSLLATRTSTHSTAQPRFG
jgi:hypothetical protein